MNIIICNINDKLNKVDLYLRLSNTTTQDTVRQDFLETLKGMLQNFFIILKKLFISTLCKMMSVAG